MYKIVSVPVRQESVLGKRKSNEISSSSNFSSEAVARRIEEEDIQAIGLYFTDFSGNLNFRTYNAADVSSKKLQEGENFDGSSHPGWQGIFNSDLTVRPALDSDETVFKNPFISTNTLNLICDIHDPVTKQAYPFDPRGVALRAEAHLKTEFGSTAQSFFGPEAEFYAFDRVEFDQSASSGSYTIFSKQANWVDGSGKTAHNGYYLAEKGGYTPAQPQDTHLSLRSKIVDDLHSIGIKTNVHHHEVGGPGQNEIGIELDTLTKSADMQQKFRWCVKNTAKAEGYAATFMPKPVAGDNGSGMHVHFSIWTDGENRFAGDEYAGLSQEALYAIGGILSHAPALAAFTNPTTNSYKRLIPGYEAPTTLAYSARNRSAAIRIPLVPDESSKARRFEYRCPDPKANPYLAFSAIQMAAMDGIKNKIDPGAPADDKDFFEMSAEEIESDGYRQLPGTLSESLSALESDNAFLTEGDVFSDAYIQRYLAFKRDEIREVTKSAPTPAEFSKYFN